LPRHIEKPLLLDVVVLELEPVVMMLGGMPAVVEAELLCPDRRRMLGVG
jgi:hypothetical protein